MNYIELIRDFWRSHERYSFSTTEIALYFHLIEICNICNWENPFKRNNAKICADLSITTNTLKNARNKLKQADIINFESKQGNPNVKYELKNIRSSKFDEVRVEVSDEVSNEVGTKLKPTKDKLNKTKEEKEIKEKKTNRFIPPTVEQVREFCIERNNHIDAEYFVAHYTANGWKRNGNVSVKDWKACVITWEKNSNNEKYGKKLNIVNHDNTKTYEQF